MAKKRKSTNKESLNKLSRTKNKIWIVAGILSIFFSLMGIMIFYNVQRYFP